MLVCLRRIELVFDELESLTSHGLYTLQELELLSDPRVSFVQTHFNLVSLLLYEGGNLRFQHLSQHSRLDDRRSERPSPFIEERMTIESRYYRYKSYFHFLTGEWELAIGDLKTAMKKSTVDDPIDFLTLAKLFVRCHAPLRAFNTLKIGLSLLKVLLLCLWCTLVIHLLVLHNLLIQTNTRHSQQ